MANPPAFFVPKLEPGEFEECYLALAAAANCAAPPLGSRIYSISFSSNGEQWTATVGQQLRGSVVKTSRRRGQRVEHTMHLSNSSTVLAIFPGVPFQVWHDQASRVWANPFLAGQPTSITYFSA